MYYDNSELFARDLTAAASEGQATGDYSRYHAIQRQLAAETAAALLSPYAEELSALARDRAIKEMDIRNWIRSQAEDDEYKSAKLDRWESATAATETNTNRFTCLVCRKTGRVNAPKSTWEVARVYQDLAQENCGCEKRDTRPQSFRLRSLASLRAD